VFGYGAFADDLPATQVAFEVQGLLHLHREEDVGVVGALPRGQLGVAILGLVASQSLADAEIAQERLQILLDRIRVTVDQALLVRVLLHDPDDLTGDLRERLVAFLVGHLPWVTSYSGRFSTGKV